MNIYNDICNRIGGQFPTLSQRITDTVNDLTAKIAKIYNNAIAFLKSIPGQMASWADKAKSYIWTVEVSEPPTSKMEDASSQTNPNVNTPPANEGPLGGTPPRSNSNSHSSSTDDTKLPKVPSGSETPPQNKHKEEEPVVFATALTYVEFERLSGGGGDAPTNVAAGSTVPTPIAPTKPEGKEDDKSVLKPKKRFGASLNISQQLLNAGNAVGRMLSPRNQPTTKS